MDFDLPLYNTPGTSHTKEGNRKHESSHMHTQSLNLSASVGSAPRPFSSTTQQNMPLRSPVWPPPTLDSPQKLALPRARRSDTGSASPARQRHSPLTQDELRTSTRSPDRSVLKRLVPGEKRLRGNVTSARTRLPVLYAMTLHLVPTYTRCQPDFKYESSRNPRRVLTKPSKGVLNEGHDNEDSDYILYVNDTLGNDGRYLILDVLGQGTFGQVVKCQNTKTGAIVAVKVIKNKPAYYNQSMMEVTILDLLNKTYDPTDAHHLLRLLDQFVHKKHLCLVFELLSSNLYELIKQNSFRGLSTSLVKVFTTQLLDCLTVLNEAHLIHCDLKPENILLKSLQSPEIKVIDFGSACHERQTVYTYIQSRFYRSPEVLLGLSYSSAIDMWSLGCIVVELFLGLPIFPGTSEYNQVARIVDMLGTPPPYMLEVGKQTSEFFNFHYNQQGQKVFTLKPLEQYNRDKNAQEQPSKKYFSATTLPDIIKTYPMSKKNMKEADITRETQHRLAFIDFVQGLLNMNPIERWSPQQAKMHPFITGAKFTAPFRPQDIAAIKANAPQPQTSEIRKAKTPTRTETGFKIPPPQTTAPQIAVPQERPFRPEIPVLQTELVHSNQDHQPLRLQHESSLSLSTGGKSPMYAVPANAQPRLTAANQSRHRASTINQMDIIPPQIARVATGLTELGQTRSKLTPIMRRDEGLMEWERRQLPGNTMQTYNDPYQAHLDYLQEQAEMTYGYGHGYGHRQRMSMYHNRGLSIESPRQGPGISPRSYSGSMSYSGVDLERSPIMQQGFDSAYGQGMIAAPPQAYSNNRYVPGTPTSPYMSSSRRGSHLMTGSMGYEAMSPHGVVPPSPYEAFAQKFQTGNPMPVPMMGTQSVPSTPTQYRLPPNSGMNQGGNPSDGTFASYYAPINMMPISPVMMQSPTMMQAPMGQTMVPSPTMQAGPFGGYPNTTRQGSRLSISDLPMRSPSQQYHPSQSQQGQQGQQGQQNQHQ